MSEFKVGDRCVVTGDTGGKLHKFEVGTEVIISKVSKGSPEAYWFCWDDRKTQQLMASDGNWWVDPNDLELIPGPPTEEELAAVYRSLGVTIDDD